MKASSVLLLVACLFFWTCQNENGRKNTTYSLGKVELEVSGQAAAQESFKKGLLLLHSFEYQDAREAFLEAQKADPEMPMALWGEAMTYNHSLWREQEYEKGQNLVQKLDTLTAQVQLHELEKDFIKALGILYKADSPKEDRDQEYATFMARLHEKYPQNQEVAAFYALSLLGSVKNGRDEDIYGKGAKIAEGILKENPQHPGALHYLIHSYDDPGHAQLALQAANNYSEVAPDASHALHMPSHIYVALGMWDEVVRSNERSYQASLNRMEQKDLGNDARGYHAYHWLEYGYLQQERTEEALEMIQNMKTYVQETPSVRARTHLIFLKDTYLVETGSWESPVADIEVDLKDLNVSVQAQYYLVEGLEAYYKKEVEKLEGVIRTLAEKREKAELLVESRNQNIPVCSIVSRESASEIDIKQAQVMENQLRGLLSDLAGDKEMADSYLSKAVDQQYTISYSYGPPFISKPSAELYAEWLAANNELVKALEYYEKTLRRTPKRTSTLKAQKAIQEKLEQQV